MQTPEVTLTEDELLVFLAIIGVSTMNGLPDEPLGGLSERQVIAKLNGGEQALVSRGLLRIDTDSVTLDDVLMALVGASVIPDATLLVNQINPDGETIPHYFCATPELYVEHFSSRLGVYHFEYRPSLNAVRLRIQTLVAPMFSVPEPPFVRSFVVSSEIFKEVISMCREKRQRDAEAILVTSGMTPLDASRLGSDLATNPTWVAVAAKNLREEEPEDTDSVMAVLGFQNCWLVENADDPNFITVRHASGPECERAFLSLTRFLEGIVIGDQ